MFSNIVSLHLANILVKLKLFVYWSSLNPLINLSPLQSMLHMKIYISHENMEFLSQEV